MSWFLQAAKRMRGLEVHQQIIIAISPTLEKILQELYGRYPTLDDIYTFLEDNEDKQNAENSFKTACQKLEDIILEDIDNRLLELKDNARSKFFAEAHKLYIKTLTDDVLILYAKNTQDMTETKDILEKEIKPRLLNEWENTLIKLNLIANRTQIETECNKVIKEALFYCEKKQKHHTNLDLGTKVQIQVQTKVNEEIKIKVNNKTKTNTAILNLTPIDIDLSWNKYGVEKLLTEPYSSSLNTLWQLNTLSKTYQVDWHNNLLISKNFYESFKEQPQGALYTEINKPTLAILFTQDSKGNLTANLVTQEEATLLADLLLTKSNSNTTQNTSYYWLETESGILGAGIKPNSAQLSKEYNIIKEQIFLFSGDLKGLFNINKFKWLLKKHIPLLSYILNALGKSYQTVHLKKLEESIIQSSNYQEDIVQEQEDTLEEEDNLNKFENILTKIISNFSINIDNITKITLNPQNILKIIQSSGQRRNIKKIILYSIHTLLNSQKSQSERLEIAQQIRDSLQDSNKDNPNFYLRAALNKNLSLLRTGSFFNINTDSYNDAIKMCDDILKLRGLKDFKEYHSTTTKGFWRNIFSKFNIFESSPIYYQTKSIKKEGKSVSENITDLIKNHY